MQNLEEMEVNGQLSVFSCPLVLGIGLLGHACFESVPNGTEVSLPLGQFAKLGDSRMMDYS
jgi:hypothetical protein